MRGTRGTRPLTAGFAAPYGARWVCGGVFPGLRSPLTRRTSPGAIVERSLRELSLPPAQLLLGGRCCRAIGIVPSLVPKCEGPWAPSHLRWGSRRLRVFRVAVSLVPKSEGPWAPSHLRWGSRRLRVFRVAVSLVPKSEGPGAPSSSRNYLPAASASCWALAAASVRRLASAW